MRIFTATLGTETNTFSPIPTNLNSFKKRMYWGPGEHPDYPTEQTAPLWVCRQRQVAEDWDVIEGSCIFATPAGIVSCSAYESLRDEILNQLKDAMPVDIVAMGMHGAMVAHDYPDCEGDMLYRIRQLVGPNVVIGVLLDPHCHMTQQMLLNASAIILFKEYPHFDYLERGQELLNLLVATKLKKIKPKMTVFDCRMLGMFHTVVEPMKSFLEELRSFEGHDGIHSISVVHGFPWGDVSDVGTKVLIVAEATAKSPKKLAEFLGRKLFELRGKTTPVYFTFEQSLEKALHIINRPVVIADTADNPGCGAPGDATFFLHKIIAMGINKVCLGPLYDPVALQMAFDAGEGSELQCRFGGKLGISSGTPIDALVKVNKLLPNATQTYANVPAPIGDAAWISFNGIDVVLTSIRCQALGPDLFTALGIKLENLSLVIVKSSQHFYTGFEPISSAIIYTADQGAITMEFTNLNYKNISRPLWPLITDPFSAS